MFIIKKSLKLTQDQPPNTLTVDLESPHHSFFLNRCLQYFIHSCLTGSILVLRVKFEPFWAFPPKKFVRNLSKLLPDENQKIVEPDAGTVIIMTGRVLFYSHNGKQQTKDLENRLSFFVHLQQLLLPEEHHHIVRPVHRRGELSNNQALRNPESKLLIWLIWYTSCVSTDWQGSKQVIMLGLQCRTLMVTLGIPIQITSLVGWYMWHG